MRRPNNPPANESIEREPFLWRFTAFFNDGSVLIQPADDKSTRHDPSAEHNPSAFSDVLERESQLRRFELRHIDKMQSISVDLATGLFTVNGTVISAHDQFIDPLEYKLKLIYYRENRLEHDAAGSITRYYTNRYFVGWQAVGGKHKALLAVS